MALKTQIVDTRYSRDVYVYDDLNPSKTKRLAYKIKKRNITFLPKKTEFFLQEIEIEGFGKLPDFISELGYLKAGMMYYFDKKLRDRKVCKLVISRTRESSYRKYRGKYTVVLNHKLVREFRERLGGISQESKQERSETADEFFCSMFPRKYKKTDDASKKRYLKTLKNLDKSIIPHMKARDVDNLLDFVDVLLSSKYKNKIKRRELFQLAKSKVDTVALVDTIELFEEMLTNKHSESEWGSFLARNLFLLDSKYVDVLAELNVVLAKSRKVDFGLIDSYGYLDIFEIKLPRTPLLAKSTDRGNYYWSTPALKAIVQAEKYLYHAGSKGANLAEDIESQTGKVVDIKRPRAFVLMGCGEQLTQKNMMDDFRILRMSLKNVEIILYDELLQRLKNQKNKKLIKIS